MKKNSVKRMMATMTLMGIAAINACQLMAQSAQVDDKEIIGVWVMDTMQWEGEEPLQCGTNYTQVKVYGADGEYACAELSKQSNGTFVVMPHEYGTYTLKNGRYSEMGRPVVEKDAFVWVDKNTTKGRWKNRHDVWKKVNNMPKSLTDYIVSTCKAKQLGQTADIQKQIGQYLFK